MPTVCVVALVQVRLVVNVHIAFLSIVDLLQDVLNGLGVPDHTTQEMRKSTQEVILTVFY